MKSKQGGQVGDYQTVSDENFGGLNKGVGFIVIKMFISMKCIYERT